MTHRGVEEVAFEAYNIVYGMLQQDTLVYQHPNKFTTRQHELQLKKAVKEVALDGSGSLTVRDKPQQATCDTNGELELVQALRRRALAFDLVGACSYETMNMYHSLLVQRIQDAPPPNYARVIVWRKLSGLTEPHLLGLQSWSGRSPTLGPRLRTYLGGYPREFSLVAAGSS